MALKKPEAVAVLDEALAAVDKDSDATPADRADVRFSAGTRARRARCAQRRRASPIATAACSELDKPEWQDELRDCRVWLAHHSAAAAR